MKLQNVNEKMSECEVYYDAFRNSHNFISLILLNVRSGNAKNSIYYSEITSEIFNSIDKIEEYYHEFGLISDDWQPFEKDELVIIKIERLIANKKIKKMEDIPDSASHLFPTNQHEFDNLQDELRDSEAILIDIKDQRERLNDNIQLLGDQSFSDLFSDIKGNVNFDNLIKNFDGFFSSYIKNAKAFAYFF